jgi:hypothetical protein
VRALCFGINVYENHTILDNCENDAEAIAERVRALSDGGNGKCFAKVCTKLSDNETMKAAVSEFLKEIPKECPPRMLIISCSGHGIQDGDRRDDHHCGHHPSSCGRSPRHLLTGELCKVNCVL